MKNGEISSTLPLGINNDRSLKVWFKGVYISRILFPDALTCYFAYLSVSCLLDAAFFLLLCH